MEIKYALAGLLIYIGLAAYAAAFIACLARKGAAARLCILSAFVAALSAVVCRWIQVRHIPMQTMFEIFLVLAMTVPLISWMSLLINVPRNYLTLAIDAVIGVLVIFPAGFIFKDTAQYLPPALQSRLFGPHVLAYMLAYIIFAKAAFLAGVCILLPKDSRAAADCERASYRMACLGFPLLTLGLLLGSVWGKLAWGDWWGWDPKEMFSLACWTMYLFYFHWRKMFDLRLPRLNCLWLLTGFVLILLTLLVVNLSKIFPGLHNYAS